MQIGAPFHTEAGIPAPIVFTYPDILVTNPSMAKEIFEECINFSSGQHLQEDLAPMATKLPGLHVRFIVKRGVHNIGPSHFLLCRLGAQHIDSKKVIACLSTSLGDPGLEERYVAILKETEQMVTATAVMNIGVPVPYVCPTKTLEQA
ncbi:MAG TPA: hypothetical protein VF534_35635 [Paraburkholderia sp.]